MPADQRLLRKNIVLFSLYFLLLFGSMGIIQPFINLHFNEIGFSGVQIGTLMVISSLALILIAPQYGMLFDNSHHKRMILVITAIITTVTLMFIPFLRTFGLVVLLYSLHRVTNTSGISATENLSYQVSSSAINQKKNSFGSIRLWGSLGFAVSALIGGRIYEQSGILKNTGLFLGIMALAVLVMLAIPKSLFQTHQGAQETKGQLRVGGILKLIYHDRYLLLTVIALAITDPLSDGIRSFEPIYMKDLHLTEAVIGVAATLSALFEMPFMLWSDRLIEKYGIRQIILIVFFFDLARRLAVWFFPFGWMVFGMSVATSLSYALRLICTVYLVNIRVPRQYTTTAITFISVTLFGISNMISNTLSGVVYDNFGGRELYLMSAIGCIASIVFALAAGKAKSQPALVKEV